MSEERVGLHYSALHNLESPASRLIRDTIWGREEDIGQQSFTTTRYMDELVHRLGLDENTHVLDVGSGTGGPALYIANLSGCRITGVEVNEVGVQTATKLVAQAGLEDRVDFHLGDAMSMPFADATFDQAISLNVMNVFEDKVGLFREVFRVLKPGGLWTFLSGTFELGDEPEVRKKLARGYLIPQFYDSLGGYKDKLREAGFELVEVTEYIADFRVQVGRWRDAYTTHQAEIAKEQGEENTAHHIDYFDTYVSLIDQGRASNHLVISRRPGQG